MNAFLAAIKFLTILPLPVLHPQDEAGVRGRSHPTQVGRKAKSVGVRVRGTFGSPESAAGWGSEKKHLSRSLPYFPLVGLLLGALLVGCDWGLSRLLPAAPVAVCLVGWLWLLSGGLHLDGLADTADGFFSSRPRERILKIMRDSRTGPMGVAAVVSVALLKITLLAAVTGPGRWAVLLLMPLAGRCAMIFVMALLPYARPKGGLAEAFQPQSSWRLALWALLALCACGWFTLSWAGVVSGLLSLAVAAGLSAYFFYKIGGYTGDTLGAACELVELVPVGVMAVYIHLGVGR